MDQHTENNRRFHEEFVKYPISAADDIPNYAAAPWLVLEVMVKRDDWGRFLEDILMQHSMMRNIDNWIQLELFPLNYILDRTGKLRDAAIEWMEGRKES